MPEVTIDGERIQLVGPAPTSLDALLASIEPALDGAGRVLSGLIVDGQACESGLSPDDYAAARHIDVVTLSVADAIKRVADGCHGTASALRGEVSQLATDVLRLSWDDVASRVMTQTEQLGRLLQDLGPLASQGPMGGVVGEYAEALNPWMDTVASRDAAAVCLCLEKWLIPALVKLEHGAGVIANGGGA